MITRYTPEAFAELWSDRTRYAVWLEIELAACAAMEEAGLVPPGTASQIRAKNLRLDPEAIERIEQKTRHDVIAFLTHVEELAGEPARWLHRGMTSSDVLDTSLAILLTRGRRSLARRVRPPRSGARHPGSGTRPYRDDRSLARHPCRASDVRRGPGRAPGGNEARHRARLVAARREIAVGKLAGAVGTYAHLDAPDRGAGPRRARSRAGDGRHAGRRA